MAQTSTQALQGQTHLMLHPAMPLWLLVIVGLCAAGLIVYLYQRQRDLAPRRTILLLTGLRLALLVLLGLIMLGPAVEKIHVKTTPGQLWLLLDHSESMGLHDPQGGKRYALRWACALGLVSDYHDTLDHDLAKLSMLEQQLAILDARQSRFTAVSAIQARRQHKRDIAALRKWLGSFDHFINALAKNGAASALVTPLRKAAESARRDMNNSTVHAGGTNTLTSIYSGVDIQLRDSLRALRKIARTADETFLTAHRSDAQLTAALNRVNNMSRAELALAMLTRSSAVHKLFSANDLHVVSFAGTASATTPASDAHLKRILHNAINPTGKRTNINKALLTTASHIEQGRRADVLLISDGRQNVGSDPTEVARIMALHHIDIYTLCMGSDRSPPEATIDSVTAPQWVFKHQSMKATAIIHLKSLAGKAVTVQLLRNGKIESTRVLKTPLKDAYKLIHFKNRPPGRGVYTYSVKILPVANLLPAVTHSFRVMVRRNKLQVLLIANQPDWNYQYMVNYFSRSRRAHLQAVLLHPAHIRDIQPAAPVTASPSNPNYLAQLLPNSPKAWQAFDVIILGDISPNDLSADVAASTAAGGNLMNGNQAGASTNAEQGIATAVKSKGAALVVIAGPGNMPQEWVNQPLAQLFPVNLTTIWPPALLQEQNNRGFVPKLTPQGRQSGLSQLSAGERTNRDIWQFMPRWYWHSAYTKVRGAARVLWVLGERNATAATTRGAGGVSDFNAERHRALLATMSVGAGRTMYFSSDQLWRLRYVNGHNVENAFLGQLLRWASGTQLPAGGRYVHFGTSHSSYQHGQKIVVRARIFDDQLLPQAGLHFNAIATPIVATSQPAGTTAPAPSGGFSAPMMPQAKVPGFYIATLTGLPTGSYHITLQGSGVARRLRDDPTAKVRELTIRVKPAANMELAEATSDPVAMRQIANAGDGVALTGPYTDILARAIHPAVQVITIPQSEGFFLHPHSSTTFWLHIAFLLLFVLLITAEWIIRKAAGLV